jgi:hypothetical protein
VQYFYNRSLWLDEAALSLNIIDRNCFELLKPLSYYQSAPILFLQIEKLFSVLIPNSELGLRLFPLISYLGSLFLFYKIIRMIQQNYYTIIFSLSLFIFNITLLYYSNEVKQYMTDVLVLTVIYYLLLKEYKNANSKYFFLGVAGVVGVFLSNASPVILITAGTWLLFNMVRNKKNELLPLAIIAVFWTSSFALYYYLFLNNNPVKDFMIAYWKDFDVFMPMNPLKTDFYKFLDSKAYMLYSSLFNFDRNGVYLLFFILAGIISLIRKKRTGIIILAILPVILHLLLSGFKMYPFDKRMLLYFCPCIIIICSFGFNSILNKLFSLFKIKRFIPIAIVVPALMLFYFFRHGFPPERDEIKKSIVYIQQHKSTDDKIYLYYGDCYAIEYYGKINYFKPTAAVIQGTNNRSEKEKYITELKRLNGRNWLLFSGTYDDEETYIIGQLDSQGYKRLASFATKGSSAYLYDFRN